MKIKEYLNASDIAAEIEALNQRIEEQEKKIDNLLIVVATLIKKD
jgi:cell division protein FtsL